MTWPQKRRGMDQPGALLSAEVFVPRDPLSRELPDPAIPAILPARLHGRQPVRTRQGKRLPAFLRAWAVRKAERTNQDAAREMFPAFPRQDREKGGGEASGPHRLKRFKHHAAGKKAVWRPSDRDDRSGGLGPCQPLAAVLRRTGMLVPGS